MVYVKIVNSILSLCTLLRLQTKASNLLSFYWLKYKCLSQSCFSISLICWGLLSITVRLDEGLNGVVAFTVNG